MRRCQRSAAVSSDPVSIQSHSVFMIYRVVFCDTSLPFVGSCFQETISSTKIRNHFFFPSFFPSLFTNRISPICNFPLLSLQNQELGFCFHRA